MKAKYFEDETGDGCENGTAIRYCIGCMDYNCPANPYFEDDDESTNEGERNERN